MRAPLLATGMLLSSGLSAATFVVTRLDDPPPNGCLLNDCSLREAVNAANATPFHDVVQLGNGTHELTRACVPDTGNCQDLDVSQPLTIQGNGQIATEIINSIATTAPNADHLHTRIIQATSTLTLRNLRLRQGRVVSINAVGFAYGGCLWTNAPNTLESVTVANCRSDMGSAGGIYAMGAATWHSVTVRDNTAGSSGGAMVDALTASDLDIIGNRSAGNCGGITVFGAAHFGAQSSVVGNRAAFYGGGVCTISGSEVMGDRNDLLDIGANVAEGYDCGGLWHAQGNLPAILPIENFTLRYVSVFDNIAKQNGGGVCLRAYGTTGANSGILTIADSEIANNLAGLDGGGLHVTNSQGQRSVVERVSFWRNRAARGALAHAQSDLKLRQVSSYDNDSGTGAIHAAQGVMDIAHLTSFADQLSLRADVPIKLAASAISSNCAGSIQDNGYNVYLAGTAGCAGQPMSAEKMGLVFGDFGGLYRVVGITRDSLLRDSLPPTFDAYDVRGWLRAGAHDIGAFEYDGTAP